MLGKATVSMRQPVVFQQLLLNASPVMSEKCPHLVHQGMCMNVSDRVLDVRRLLGLPIKLGKVSGKTLSDGCHCVSGVCVLLHTLQNISCCN